MFSKVLTSLTLFWFCILCVYFGHFFRNNNPFFITPAVVRVKISEKKTISFSGFKPLYFLQSGKMVTKYGHLILAGAFPNNFTPDIDLTDYVELTNVMFQL